MPADSNTPEGARGQPGPLEDSGQPSRVDRVRQDVRDGAQSIATDTRAVGRSLREDPGRAPVTIKQAVLGHLRFWVTLGILTALAAYMLEIPLAVPDWAWVTLAVLAIATLVILSVGRWAESFFVSDRRVSVLAISGQGKPLKEFKVPRTALSDVDLVYGDWEEVPTGSSDEEAVRVVREAAEIQQDGETTLAALGTWQGSVSGLELQRDRESIRSMYEQLEPLARQGFLYELKWPQIQHEMQQEIAQIMTAQMQGVSLSEGEIMDLVDSVSEEYAPGNLEDNLGDSGELPDLNARSRYGLDSGVLEGADSGRSRGSTTGSGMRDGRPGAGAQSGTDSGGPGGDLADRVGARGDRSNGHGHGGER